MSPWCWRGLAGAVSPAWGVPLLVSGRHRGSAHAVTPEVAADLALPQAATRRQLRIASIHQVVMAPVVEVASLQVGAQVLTQVEALVLPLPQALRVDGLLGVNVWARFRTTFLFAQAQIVLRALAP